MIYRRGLIAGIGALAAWPLAIRAQQPTMPIVGYLHASSPETNVEMVAAFRKALSEAGFVEGQNVAIEFRWAAGKVDRLPELAADLVRRRVAVIATPADSFATLAAKAATSTIPIVFGIGADPIDLGLVKSLNRPGDNVTGIAFQTLELTAKRVGMLRELAPQATRFVVLIDGTSPFADSLVKDVEASTATQGLPTEILRVSTVGEIDAAFVKLAQGPNVAMLITPSVFMTSRRSQLVTLAVRHAIPTIYPIREFVDVGGLISYGPKFLEVYRQAALYVGRILKGDKPGDLPVIQPTKFELVINLTNARALGINVPQSLLSIADEVIE
jgi:putative tryptophan/tyrosine transport system substrate-binding protein